MDAKLAATVGETREDLIHKRTEETNIGNLIADSIRASAAAQIALHNAGGVRDSIPKGPVTMRQIYSVLPFDNTVVTVKMTGAQIKEVLELSAGAGGSRILPSGLSYTFDSSRPRGHRIVSATVDGKALAVTRTYLVATNNFLSDGGDGYSPFSDARERKDTGVLLRDAVAGYIGKHTPVAPKIEGRIIERRGGRD